MKGETQIPKWLSPGAQNMIRRILDPNPVTRITMAGIKSDDWFQQGYVPANTDEEDTYIDEDAFSIHEVVRNFILGSFPQPFLRQVGAITEI